MQKFKKKTWFRNNNSNRGFSGILLGTLGASLLGKMLARKGIVRAGSVVLEIKNEKEL